MRFSPNHPSSGVSRLPGCWQGLFILFGTLFQAWPACSADLLQAYHDALGNDAQYAAARATVEAGREKQPQGLAGLLPSIGATANTVWNENRFRLDDGPKLQKNYNTHGYVISLTQPLFRWQNIAQYGQARWQVVQAEVNFAQAAQDLILRVAQAYFDVLYAQENLKALRASKQTIAQQLEQAKKYFEVGTATITDTHEAQSRYDLISAQELAAENDLTVKRYALLLMTGREYGELGRLKPDALLPHPRPVGMEAWVEAAEKDSFPVLAQQAMAEIAAKEVERLRAGHYPTLDAVATYGKNSAPAGAMNNSTLETDVRSIGLQLNIPLFQGGYVNSKAREAAANKLAADAALESARRLAALGARQSYLGVVSGLSQIKAFEAALVSSTSALESNRLGYEVGVRINIDVLNAEQQVYVTQRDLVKARLDTLLAQLRLKAAVGTLEEADLKELNPLFER